MTLCLPPDWPSGDILVLSALYLLNRWRNFKITWYKCYFNRSRWCAERNIYPCPFTVKVIIWGQRSHTVLECPWYYPCKGMCHLLLVNLGTCCLKHFVCSVQCCTVTSPDQWPNIIMGITSKTMRTITQVRDMFKYFPWRIQIRIHETFMMRTF